MKILAILLLSALYVSANVSYSCPASCQISSSPFLNNHQDCWCGSLNPPVNFANKSDLPQFVMLSFDDGIIPTVWTMINQLLLNTSEVIYDARGCTPRATMFVTTDNTNYEYATQLYAAGHEIAVHTVTHTTGSATSMQTWYGEIHEARAIISSLGKIPLSEIVGFRAPFLAYNDNMFQTLRNEGFLYDCSVTDEYGNDLGSTKNTGMMYPFTYDYGSPIFPDTGELSGTYPGLWEVPMNGIENVSTSELLADMDVPLTGSVLLNTLKQNFDVSYNHNRSPWGLFVHGAWLLADPTRINTLYQFFEYAASKNNVFFATPKQIISWMRNPVPASQIYLNPDFTCPAAPSTPSVEICDGIDNDLDGQVDEGLLNFCNNYGGNNFYTCAPCPSVYPNVASPYQGYIPSCGNGTCDSLAAETCVNCPQDCPCATTQAVGLTTSPISDGCVGGCGLLICNDDNSTIARIDSIWTNGMCGTLLVSNKYSTTVTSWQALVTFDIPFQFSSPWAFSVQPCGNSGTTYLITPNGDTSIAPGSTDTTRSFCGGFVGNSLHISARAQLVGVTTAASTGGAAPPSNPTTGSITSGSVSSASVTSSSITGEDSNSTIGEDSTTGNSGEDQDLTSSSVPLPITSSSVTSSAVTSSSRTSGAKTSSPLTTKALTTKAATSAKITSGKVTSSALTSSPGLTSSPAITSGLSPSCKFGAVQCSGNNILTCVYVDSTHTGWSSSPCSAGQTCHQSGSQVTCS